MSNTRTRFAPSPTGFMHVGSVRTALFDWLIARKNNGQFILRIEDTDKVREQAGSTEHIIESLHWLGLQWDEGIDIGGPFAPYLQSERLNIYKEWAQKLVAAGRAYADPYSKEELDNFRNEAKENKKAFLYRDYRPECPPQWDGSQPLRFKSEPKVYKWHDAVMGDLESNPQAIDDFVLIKSDGYPTYNFCHIVDDCLMGITHVLRSQEYISSIPRYLNLYEALGIKRPVLVTLPFVMAIDGKKKLSKRDGAKGILDYAKEGYLPEAIINFLATLGWNDGTEQEVFSVEELIAKFDITRIQKSPARFDEKRLLWLNGQHIRSLSIEDLYNRCNDFWPVSSLTYQRDYKTTVLSLVQDRLKTLSDLPLLTNYFFEEPTQNIDMILNDKYLSKKDKNDLANILKIALDELSKIDFTAEGIQVILNNLIEKTGEKPGIVFSLIRYAISWAPFSPVLNETLATLGKEKSINRINKAIALLS